MFFYFLFCANYTLFFCPKKRCFSTKKVFVKKTTKTFYIFYIFTIYFTYTKLSACRKAYTNASICRNANALLFLFVMHSTRAFYLHSRVAPPVVSYRHLLSCDESPYPLVIVPDNRPRVLHILPS